MLRYFSIVVLLLTTFSTFGQGGWLQKCEEPCDSSLVYYYEIDNQIREQIWSLDASVANDDPYKIFAGIANSDSYGTPSHPNVPNIDLFQTDWNENTGEDPSNGADQHLLVGYFYADKDNTIIGDRNNNNGESYRIWLGSCFNAPSVIYESPYGDPSPFVGGLGNAIGDFYTVNKGWHLLIVEMSDAAAFGGFDLHLDGVRYTGPRSYLKPKLQCKTVPCGYILQDMEFDCVPDGCQPNAIITSSGEPTVIPDLELLTCDGTFNICSNNRTGWWTGWSPVFTTTTGTVLDETWYDIGNAVTSPDCVTDLVYNVDFGNWYTRVRRARLYLWVDFRLLVNGAPVETVTYEIYFYQDGMNDTNPDVIQPIPVDIENFGSTGWDRQNIPANASVQVQGRIRYNVNGVQASSYARYIPAVRSNTCYNFHTRTELTDVAYASNLDYWLLSEYNGYTSGIGGQIPLDADVFNTKQEWELAIEQAEKKASEDNIAFVELLETENEKEQSLNEQAIFEQLVADVKALSLSSLNSKWTEKEIVAACNTMDDLPAFLKSTKGSKKDKVSYLIENFK